MPAAFAAEMENLLEQRSVEDSPDQSERLEEQREPDQRSEVSLHRSNRIQANAGLIDASSSLRTDALPKMVETLVQDIRELEPECYSEATSDARWQEAMRSEYSSLKAHGTFTHVRSYDRKPT